MRPFGEFSGRACPLPLASIDTDQLIPARFMRRPRTEGYGRFLLHDLRFDAQGAPRPDCVLNDPAFAACEVIVARRNFGCGSSREAAVYALADYGIRAVIAPSFGDIFASNAVKNGLLPAVVSEADAEALLEAGASMAGQPLAIDLAAQAVRLGNLVIAFAIDPVWKTQLVNGWDDIDLTLTQVDEIATFTERDRLARPWMQPVV